MSKVTIENVTKSFGSVGVLRAISLVVEESSLVSLLGPSGCGKTTLLRLVAGLEEAGGGRILVGDRPVSDPERGIHIPVSDRNVGMVFQSYALWPHKRVWENVAHPLRIRKVPRDEMMDRIVETLRLVQLEALRDRFPGELSGGQQQRVALARAIVYEPNVLLLDEPLSNLDAKLRAEMRYEIRELQRRCRLTTIYVTHDQEEAFVISDQICLMNGGLLEQMGNGLDLYEKPLTRFTAEFVGAANQIPGAVSEVLDRESCRVRVAKSWHLSARHTSSLPVGAKVWVLIRPHDIRLEAQDAARNEGILAIVRNVTYLGGTTEYLVIAGEIQLRAREIGRPRFGPTQPVVASIGDNQSVALPISNA